MSIEDSIKPIKVVFICQYNNSFLECLRNDSRFTISKIISTDSFFDDNSIILNTDDNDLILEELNRTESDYIITFGWNKLFSKQITSSHNIINIHPSYLPEYRGAKPIESILNRGEFFGGITFHIVDEFEDKGKILYRELIDLTNVFTVVDYQSIIQSKKYLNILKERILLKRFNNNIRSSRNDLVKEQEIIQKEKSVLFNQLIKKKHLISITIPFNLGWIKRNKIFPIRLFFFKTIFIYLKK